MRPMSSSLPPLITALLQPARYPHPVEDVELVQTHISWVLLAGEFAYKIKKPVTLPFLDFGTLERRRTCCEDELRLNRRFAPDLYLEVVPITGTPETPHWGGSGEVIDYAVKMRRFDEAQRLDHVCERAELTPEHLSDMAQGLVRFHDAAAVAPPASRFGTPQRALAPALDNFRLTAPLLPDAALQARLDALRHWTEAQFETLAPLMQARREQGFVRECHGDLHLANMVLLQGHVRMFDCIEFNEDLRWIDVASERAFTYMDLLGHDRPGLANWFVDQVLSHSGDHESVRLLRFYAMYRAMVRAKVAAIRAGQASAEGARDEAVSYIGLAERIAAPATPRLVITHGLSGCGKSTASRQWVLGDATGSMLRLRSDVERKRLFGLSALQSSGSTLDGGIYVADAHQRTYARLQELAELMLRAGWSVVVDAAFLRRGERAAFAVLAQRCGAGYGILAPQASVDELRARITARQAGGNDASEATLAVLDKQLSWIEPLDAHERQFILAAAPA